MTRLCPIIPVEAMATRLLDYEINVPLGLCGKACDLNGYLPSAQWPSLVCCPIRQALEEMENLNCYFLYHLPQFSSAPILPFSPTFNTARANLLFQTFMHLISQWTQEPRDSFLDARVEIATPPFAEKRLKQAWEKHRKLILSSAGVRGLENSLGQRGHLGAVTTACLQSSNKWVSPVGLEGAVAKLYQFPRSSWLPTYIHEVKE